MRSFASIALLLAACTRAERPVETDDVRRVGYELSHVVRVTAEDPLVSYSWDGGASVPADLRPGDHTIEFGEAGADERTRFYVTFDGSRETPQPALEGRFGKGGSGRVTTVEEGLLERPFVLSLWVRPTTRSLVEARILEVGPLSVRLKKDGTVRARLDTDPPLGLMAGPVRPGEWNHVAVALDGPGFPQMRLILNGAFACGRIEVEPAFEDGAKLVFGEPQGSDVVIDDVSIRGYPTSSADLIDRWRLRAAPGEHVLELVRENGVERVTPWAGVLDSPVLETEEQWATGGLRHAVAGPEGLRRVPAHWERIHAPFPPLARTTHPTVYVGDHQVFVFGGETRDTHGWVWGNTNDTWIFHTDEGRWERVETEVQPEPSCHQPAAYSPDHHMVLYPGGWRNDVTPNVHYEGTWFFRPKERRWERRVHDDEGPEFPSVSNIGLVYHPSYRRFFAFVPGHTKVMAYEPDVGRWKRGARFTAVNEAGESVDFRLMGSPMVGVDPKTGTILYFGGGTGVHESRFSDRTALFDPRRNMFTVLDTETAPSPRVRSGFAYDSRRGYFVLFGGVQDHASQRNDDLWVFDPAEKRWREVEASNPPSARGGYYGMAYDPELDRFFLLCGRHSKGRFLDEAWSLHLDFASEGEATYVLDRESFPAGARWFAETSTPDDSRVAFRFRTGSDLSSWGPWSDSAEALDDARYVQVEVRLVPGPGGAEPTVARMGFR